jgi:flagellin
MKVLDGSAKNLSFQVGANVGEVINVGLDKGMKADQIGQLATGSISGFTATSAVAGATTASSAVTTVTGTADPTAAFAATVNGKSISVAAGTGRDQADYLTAVNDALTTAGAGVTASVVSGSLTFTSTATGSAAAATVTGVPSTTVAGKSIGDGAVAVGDAQSLTLSGTTLKVGDNDSFSLNGTYKTAQDLADAINSKSNEGISAYVGQDGSVKFASGSNVTVTSSSADTTASGLSAGTLSVASSTTTLADSSVSTVDGANQTINRIDAALQSVSDLRSTLGAVQNRFDSTISNLQNISQNLTSSKSSITDADFAQETANMSSAQILQQAGVSVLAQANQSQQIVTKLLQ